MRALIMDMDSLMDMNASADTGTRSHSFIFSAESCIHCCIFYFLWLESRWTTNKRHFLKGPMPNKDLIITLKDYNCIIYVFALIFVYIFIIIIFINTNKQVIESYPKFSSKYRNRKWKQLSAKHWSMVLNHDNHSVIKRERCENYSCSSIE